MIVHKSRVQALPELLKDVLIAQDICRIGFIDRLVSLLSFRYLFYFCLGS